MESVEDILSAQLPSANLYFFPNQPPLLFLSHLQLLTSYREVYKDSFAPPPPSRRIKAWERAPRAASAPRLQGQKIWKRPGLRSHDNKENDEAAQAELIKGGTGSRKRARMQGAKENISDAKWMDEFTQSNETEIFCNTGEGTRLSMGFIDTESLMVPRKRTNANHLVTPRKALRKRPSHESNQTVLSPVKVLEEAPEKPVRKRASMRQSIRRLTVESGDIEVQAAVAFGFESPSGATRDSVELATSHNILSEGTAVATLEVQDVEDMGSTAVEPAKQITPPPKVFEGNVASPSVKQQQPSSIENTPSKCNTQDTPMGDQTITTTTTPELQFEQEPEVEISEEEQIAEQLYATSPVKRPVTVSDEVSVPIESRRKSLVHVPMENSQGPITPISKKGRRTSKARWTNERPATRRSTRSTRSSLFTINQETMLIEQLPEPTSEAPLSSTPENQIKVSVREVMPTPQAVMKSELDQLLSPWIVEDDVAIPIDFTSAVVPASEAPATEDDEMIWSGKADGESEAHEDTDMAEEQNNDHSHLDESKAFEDTVVTNQQDDDQSHMDESETLGNAEVFDQQDGEKSGDFENHDLETSSETGNDSPHTPDQTVEQEDVDDLSHSSPTPSATKESPTSNDFEQISPSKTASSSSSDVDETIAESLEVLEPISVSLDGTSSVMAADETLDTVMEDVTVEINVDVNPQDQKQTNYDPDDTNVLLDFLNRHANKAAKAPRKRSLPHSPLRLPLTDAEETTGSASPEAKAEAKDKFDISVAPAEKPNKRRRRNSRSQNDTDLTEPPTSIRRSGRTRLPVVKSSQLPPAPSSIPFRRLGQDNTVTIQQSKEKELAALTRRNTRKNKGGALYPLDVLAKKDEKGDIPSRQKALKEVFDEKSKREGKGKKAKNVVWAEQLEHWSDGKRVEVVEKEKEAEKEKEKEKEKSIIVKKKVEVVTKEVVKEKEPVPVLEEKKVAVVEEKEKKPEVAEKKRSSIPRVSMRSKMALGMAANGTPAPKRRAKRS